MALYKHFGFKNSGLTLELRLKVGIGRSEVMIGRICLNMVLVGGGKRELRTTP